MSIDNILDKAKAGADSAEVYSERIKSSSVSFENSVIKDSSSTDLGGTSLRVIKNGKIGFSSSSKPNDDSIVDYALDVAKEGKEVKFSFSKSTDTKAFDIDTTDFDSLTEEVIIDTCDKVVDELKAIHDNALAECEIKKIIAESRVINSNGLDLSQKVKTIIWGCGLDHKSEGNFLSVNDFRICDQFTGFDQLVRKVKDDFAICQTNVNIEPGKYKVMFSPRGIMYLINVFLACLNGFAVAKGISPWSNRIGESIFDKRISIRSNLTGDDAPVRMAFDNEGTPTGVTNFINKGVLESFYHSLDSAAQTNQKPTGHGFKSGFAALPMSSGYGFEFAPGETELEDMMNETDIWVDDIIGAMMSNPYSGIISGNPAMSFTIKDGVKTAQIKDAMLSINVFDLFKTGIVAVSKDVEQLGMPPFFPIFKAPYILVDGVSIAAK